MNVQEEAGMSFPLVKHLLGWYNKDNKSTTLNITQYHGAELSGKSLLAIYIEKYYIHMIKETEVKQNILFPQER